MDTNGEIWRRICEAREWLRRGYTTAEKVADLHKRIKSKRGNHAAETLRQDMREQYSKRGEWE